MPSKPWALGATTVQRQASSGTSRRCLSPKLRLLSTFRAFLEQGPVPLVLSPGSAWHVAVPAEGDLLCATPPHTSYQADSLR